MPVQSKKSGLAARLGNDARKAFVEKRAEDPKYDTTAGLPAGIEGGIAQLVDCKFTQIAAGKQNAGKDMFYAAGVVVSPSEFAGINLVGLRTQISEPLYDTPTRSRKTIEDHLDWVMNEMKKLGLDMSEMDLDDLESAAETLKDQQPHFRFRTWAGDKVEIAQRGGKWFAGTKGPYPTEQACKTANPYAGREPLVNHVWNGTCDYIGDDAAAGAVDDNTPDEEVEGKPTVRKPTKPTTPSMEETSTGEDLSELAAAADGGDEEAAARLVQIARGAGLDDDAISNAESWVDVVAQIEGTEPVESEESAEEEWKPEKGEVYGYKAPGMRKPVDCEVAAVFEGKETVNLKNLANGQVYKTVPWAKLVTDKET